MAGANRRSVVFLSAVMSAVLAAALPAPARAADAVTDAMQAAYAPYRVALFRTNSKAQAESAQAIQRVRAEWRAVGERFAAAPPAPYDRDSKFAATLAEVAAVYERAQREIDEGRLDLAHETLERARDLLSDLRRRNGVVVFSDHMNAYHEAMEHLLAEAPKLLAAPQGMMELMARVGALGYLAQRLVGEAPAVMAADARFSGLAKGVQDAVAALRASVLAQDPAAVKAALTKLKAPYSRLFLDFG